MILIYWIKQNKNFKYARVLFRINIKKNIKIILIIMVSKLRFIIKIMKLIAIILKLKISKLFQIIRYKNLSRKNDYEDTFENALKEQNEQLRTGFLTQIANF